MTDESENNHIKKCTFFDYSQKKYPIILLSDIKSFKRNYLFKRNSLPNQSKMMAKFQE